MEIRQWRKEKARRRTRDDDGKYKIFRIRFRGRREDGGCQWLGEAAQMTGYIIPIFEGRVKKRERRTAVR
uniref:Uncharacterized protein n=1 Tax=Lotus japonicus TaxID=34305 RepID=I3SK88_LOTJA|nr:unknown [Lotus japonicus]